MQWRNNSELTAARRREPSPDTGQAMRALHLCEVKLFKALRKRQEWVTSSMVEWLLRKQADHAENHWKIIHSFLFPNDKDLICRSNRGIQTLGRYGTCSGEVALRKQVYYLRVEERSVRHYLPCIILPRNTFRHARQANGYARGSTDHQYVDSDEDREATDILHWYCPVCEKTVTDEYYETLYDGLWRHLSSPCHDHTRHRKRYPGLPLFVQFNLSRSVLRRANWLPLRLDQHHQQLTKWYHIHRLYWWQTVPCKEWHYHQGIWYPCDGHYKANRKGWVKCSNDYCDGHHYEVTTIREVQIVTRWRHLVCRKYLNLVATSPSTEWSTPVEKRWRVLVIETILSHFTSDAPRAVSALKPSVLDHAISSRSHVQLRHDQRTGDHAQLPAASSSSNSPHY